MQTSTLSPSPLSPQTFTFQPGVVSSQDKHPQDRRHCGHQSPSPLGRETEAPPGQLAPLVPPPTPALRSGIPARWAPCGPEVRVFLSLPQDVGAARAEGLFSFALVSVRCDILSELPGTPPHVAARLGKAGTCCWLWHFQVVPAKEKTRARVSPCVQQGPSGLFRLVKFQTLLVLLSLSLLSF